MALYRNCRSCGKRLSLRKMPEGHWVAFDAGTGRVHECEAEKRRATTANVAAEQGPPGAKAVAIRRTDWEAKPVGKGAAPKATGPSQSADRAAVYSVISTAIAERRCVRLTYYSSSRDVTTVRVVEPIGLQRGTFGGAMFTAFCRLRQDVRTFAITNVRHAELLEETFERRIPVHTVDSGQEPSTAKSGTDSGAAWLVVAALLLIWWLARR